jgi:hypothetical protein
MFGRLRMVLVWFVLGVFGRLLIAYDDILVLESKDLNNYSGLGQYRGLGFDRASR